MSEILLTPVDNPLDDIIRGAMLQVRKQLFHYGIETDKYPLDRTVSGHTEKSLYPLFYEY